jgi:ribonuclease HII
VAASARVNVLDPDLTQEAVLAGGGFRRIAGVDEAGRGAWAGPLVAGAVVLPDVSTLDVGRLAGVRDSKLLTHAQREALFEVVLEVAVDAGVGWTNADEVDLLGLTAANELAMVRAVRALGAAPDHLLVDAFRLRSVGVPQRAIVHGDRVCLSIAAASIVAKVFRDRWLADLGVAYPAYGFGQHRGYGVAQHRQAIVDHGACGLHRLSYAPLRTATVQ